MRSLFPLMIAMIAALMAVSFAADSWAYDYNHRFVRNYPPGFYGMWYKSEKFVDPGADKTIPDEPYRWDRFMSKVTDIYYPFFPIPYAWDYGTGRTFNMPDYNSNDWDY